MSKKIKYEKVIADEDVRLKQRRKNIMGQDFADALDENRFGIALSGGGIRSATINLGILKTLHKFGIIKQADYLSTVSGGGYTGAYVQATLKEGDKDYKLFDDAHIEYMRAHGEYLFPGTGWSKIWNQFTLIIAFIISFLMSLVSPAVIVLLLTGFYLFLAQDASDLSAVFLAHWKRVFPFLFFGGTALFVLHYIFNTSRVYKLDISTWFNKVETFLAIVLGVTFVWPLIEVLMSIKLPGLDLLPYMIVAGFVLILLGFITNPNATSFHRFYRKQLADAYLNFAFKNKNIEIHKLFDTNSSRKDDYLAPYPLINTCLNLQASNDDEFIGTKSNDYFLLSPLYCGCKLLGYVPTAESNGYNQMTLPAAATISAAAVNPGMGIYSNKILSILLTLFNLRLGFWTWNPKQMKKRRPIVWWPVYFFYELFGTIGTDKKMVNISDGGHIENLGVMELLRRKCKLIIAVDAGADPDFSFADLENLTVRARNELGVDIRFREDQIPEDVMRINPSHGYSKKRLAIADMFLLWETIEENGKKKTVHHKGGKKSGVFVYVKSAVTAPKGKPNISFKEEPLKYMSYHYKRFNPDFPHQSTADQFFDPVQWEAYFQLGQFIGSDILGCDNLNKFDVDEAFTIPLDELYKHLDEEDMPLFGSVELPTKRGRSRSIDEKVMATTLKEEVGVPTDYEM